MAKLEVEKANGLVFEFRETEPDGGGSLTIIGSSPEVKETLCDMFRKDEPKTTKYAPLMSPDPMTIVMEPRDHKQASYGRVAWYAFPLALDDQWFIPYKKQLERLTGYAGDIGDFAIVDTKHLCYTRHRAAYRVEDGHIQATIYIEAHPWGGKSALDYGHGRAEDMFIRSVSHTDPVREFIQNGNGTYSHNPKYATGYQPPARPATEDADLWRALFAWWRANHASPAQRAMLDTIEAEPLASWDHRPWDSVYGRGIYGTLAYVPDPAGKCDYDGKGDMRRVVSWDEFANM